MSGFDEREQIDFRMEYFKLLFTDSSVEDLKDKLEMFDSSTHPNTEVSDGCNEVLTKNGNEQLLELFIKSCGIYMKGILSVQTNFSLNIIMLHQKFGMKCIQKFIQNDLQTVLDIYRTVVRKKTYYFYRRQKLRDVHLLASVKPNKYEIFKKHVSIHELSMYASEHFTDTGGLPKSLKYKNQSNHSAIETQIKEIRDMTYHTVNSMLLARCVPKNTNISDITVSGLLDGTHAFSPIAEGSDMWVEVQQEACWNLSHQQQQQQQQQQQKNTIGSTKTATEEVHKRTSTRQTNSVSVVNYAGTSGGAAGTKRKTPAVAKKKNRRTISIPAFTPPAKQQVVIIKRKRQVDSRSMEEINQDNIEKEDQPVVKPTNNTSLKVSPPQLKIKHEKVQKMFLDAADPNFDDDLFVYIGGDALIISTDVCVHECRNCLGKLQCRDRMKCSAKTFNAAVMQEHDRVGYTAISSLYGSIEEKFPNISRDVNNHIETVMKDGMSAIINACKTDEDNGALNATDDQRTCGTTFFETKPEAVNPSATGDQGTCETSSRCERTSDINPIEDFTVYLYRILVALKIIHPDQKFHNSKGVPGCETLKKTSGLPLQGPHTDFWSVGYLSFLQSVLNPNTKFDLAKDGGHSCFVNGSDEDDWLCLSHNRKVRIPAHGVLIIAGNLQHYGGDNYRSIGGVFKLFFYIDPPLFNRAIDELKADKVYPVIERAAVIRLFAEPHTTIATIPYDPYGCIGRRSLNKDLGCEHGCCDDMFYTYPYCKACLKLCGVVLKCEKDIKVRHIRGSDWNYSVNKWSASRPECAKLLKDCSLMKDCLVIGNVMSVSTFHIRNPSLRGQLVGAILMRTLNTATTQSKTGMTHKIPSNTIVIDDSAMLLDCNGLRSFVAGFTQSNNYRDCNVELVLNSERIPVLCTLKDIKPGSSYVLYNPLYSEKPLFNVQFDSKMMRDISRDGDDLSDTDDDEV